jgi:hypothetical protein
VDRVSGECSAAFVKCIAEVRVPGTNAGGIRSPHERSDMRGDSRRDRPGCRFAHPGYGAVASHGSAFSRHDLPELCIVIALRKREGAGNTGCWPHPRALRAKKLCISRTQATTGQPGQPAFPARWVTAYTSSPRRAGLSSRRRLARSSPRSLIPASGDRDPTISPSAPARLVCRAQPRPPHPASRFVTNGQTPLLPRQDGATIRLICTSDKANYFRMPP